MLVMRHCYWMIWCRGKGASERARVAHVFFTTLRFRLYSYLTMDRYPFVEPCLLRVLIGCGCGCVCCSLSWRLRTIPMMG